SLVRTCCVLRARARTLLAPEVAHHSGVGDHEFPAVPQIAKRFFLRSRAIGQVSRSLDGMEAHVSGMAAGPAVIGGAGWCLNPRELFRFPREQPVFWAVVMVAYPILSVWPQEIIYRAYFLQRYRPILGNTWLLLLASSVAFAFAHIVFANSIAIILTFVAGWLFATTYMRTRFLPFVAVQHSLYGCAVFTIGLGHYFYHGTARFLEGIAHSHSGL